MSIYVDENGNVVNEQGQVVISGGVMGRAFGFHPTGVQVPPETVDTPAGEFPVDPAVAQQPAVYEPQGEPGPLVETPLPVGPTTDAPVEQTPLQLQTGGSFGPPAGEFQLETPELGGGLPQAGDSLSLGAGPLAAPPTAPPSAEALSNRQLATDLALRTDPSAVELPIIEAEQAAETHQRRAIEQGVDLAEREGAIVGQYAGEAEKEIGRATDAMRQIAEDDLELRQETRAEVSRIGKKLEHTQIDPKRHWANASTWNKVGIALGMFLGGMSAVFTKTGRNPAMEMLNRLVEQDLAAQKANLANLRSAHSARVSELGLIRQETNDKLAQENLFRANKLEQIQLKLKKDMAGLKGEQARQKADLLYGELETQKRGYLEAAFKRTMARKTFQLGAMKAAASAAKRAGRGGAGKPKPGDEGLKQQLYPTSGVFYNLQTGKTLGSAGKPEALPIDELAVAHRGEVRSKLTAAQDLANAIATVKWVGANRNLIKDADKATAAMLMNRVKLAMQSYVKGIPSDKDMEMVDKAMGGITDPQKFFELLNESERLSVMQGSVEATKDGLNVMLNSYGYGIRGFKGRRIPMPGGEDEVGPRDTRSMRQREKALVEGGKAEEVVDEGLTGGDVGEGVTGSALQGQAEHGQAPPESVRGQRFHTKLTKNIEQRLELEGVPRHTQLVRLAVILKDIDGHLARLRKQQNDPRQSQKWRNDRKLELQRMEMLRRRAVQLTKRQERKPIDRDDPNHPLNRVGEGGMY